MRQVRRLRSLIAVGAIVGAVALPASAQGVTIGSNLSSTPTVNDPCGNPGIPCTAMTFDAPPAVVAPGGLRSPIDGVVTSWSFKAGSSGATPSVSLRVLRPVSGFTFTGAGTSTPQAPTGAIAGPFLTQLPINAGDAIGLQSTSGAIVFGATPVATAVYWQLPNLADGQTLMGLSQTSREVMVQATVEPASAVNANPEQRLKAKRRQKLAKAAVTDRLDKSGTVSLRARVKVSGGSKSSGVLRAVARAVKSKESRTTLAAEAKTKIKLKFRRKARKKIKAAIRRHGPRKVVVRATATDAFGNKSSSKVRFKLIG